MNIEKLQAELEQLFELGDLLEAARRWLGIDPSSLAGTNGIAVASRSLVDHCVEHDAIEALCDVVAWLRPSASEDLRSVPRSGLVEPILAVGSSLEGFVIEKLLGSGPTGGCYVAMRPQVSGAQHQSASSIPQGPSSSPAPQHYRLKVMHRTSSYDRRGLQRFLSFCRYSRVVSAGALPENLQVIQHGNMTLVAHSFVEGEPLSHVIERQGALRLPETLQILRPLLDALHTMHGAGLIHGNIKAENILITGSLTTPRVCLIDGGTDRLRSRGPATERGGLLAVASPKTVAPELLRGSAPSVQSDLYAIGVVLFEMLTGNAPFSASSAAELALAHLGQRPGMPSQLAPQGGLGAEVDQLLLDLLSKQPEERPRDARRLLDSLEVLVLRRSQRPPPPAADLEAAMDTLLHDPENSEAALALETAASEGADARRIAECLRLAFERLGSETPWQAEAKAELAFRAGRMYRVCDDFDSAEQVYAQLLESQPRNRVARTAFENLLRDGQKYDELIEFWLNAAEKATNSPERASLLAHIGQLYEHELNDPQQALLAHCQSLCVDPEQAKYEQAVTRLANQRPEAWAEVLEICGEAVQQLVPSERTPLLLTMASWYVERVNRYDLALQCYDAILSIDMGCLPALAGKTRVLRHASRWAELAQLLLRRSVLAPTPAARRDLQTEAAELFDTKLAEPERALSIYEEVLEEDPLHQDALEALRAHLTRANNHAAFARLLRRQLEVVRGVERQTLLGRLALVYEEQLGDSEAALQLYREVLSESVSNVGALQGIARIHTQQGNHDELFKNLKQQFEFAATPRKKVALALQMGQLLEAEFFDQQRAIESYEVVLQLDPRNAEALSQLARIYRTQKRWAEQRDVLSRHLDVSEDDNVKRSLLLAKAQAEQQLGNSAEAIAAYEAALVLRSDDSETLTKLAALQQSAGAAMEALRSLDALAISAPRVDAKVDNLMRAADLLAQRGDLAGAVERHQRALELIPNHPPAATGLRQAYLALGQPQRALQTLLSQIGSTAPGPDRARLTGELALLQLQSGGDAAQAEAAAREALAQNDTQTDALFALGVVTHEAGRYQEALEYFTRLSRSLESLPLSRALEATARQIDAASKLGNTEAALAPAQRLLALAPDDPTALRQIADVLFNAGRFNEAAPLYERLTGDPAKAFSSDDRADIALRLAEAVRRLGETDRAVELFENALDINPRSSEPLKAMAEIFSEKQQWHEVWDIKRRMLDVSTGDARVELLLQLGELAASKLNDRGRAASSFVAALDSRPSDRNILSRLMQIYTEERDWANTLEVVLKLADFVEEDGQKARYLITAGMISLREMNDSDVALDCYERALKLDPTLDKALDECTKILTERGDFDAIEVLVKRKMKAATAALDSGKTLDAFLRLGHLYRLHMRRTDAGVEVYEAALTLDPQNRNAKDALFELYLKDAPRYFNKARDLQHKLLEAEPYRAESYKSLRRLYTELKSADGAWCLCQALSVLKLAEPDEERFYKRMRSDDPAHALAVLSDEDYRRILFPESLDPLLSDLFACIEPAVIANRGYEYFQLGYDPNLAVDLARHAYPIGQTLHYAAGVMGIAPPPCFDNTNDPGGLAFLDTKTPAISMGMGVLTGEIHPQAIAFLAGRHLTYYRPGFFLRQLVGTGTGLKAWLFAAIKLISPQFPVTPDIAGAVQDNATALAATFAPHARDVLARLVSKLVQGGGALDLKRWVACVDQTADRMGFLLAHDLETSVEVIRRSADADGSSEQRIRELVQFSISPGYLELRQKLQVHLAI